MEKEKFNPVESSKNIKEEYVSYMYSTFDLSDSKMYDKKFKIELDKRSLYKGPFLDISSVFEKGKTIKDLIDTGLLSKEFHKMKELHISDRTLYKHQENAIKKAVSGTNIVVSTGTGSGKTESFLIPIIDYLLKQKETNELGPGVRAMLLYPMNALANDQLERVREILCEYPEITFGRYTGETEEEKTKALIDYRALNNKEPLINELISREEMKNTPPNILFTNYSMLEYLMIRPDDKSFFIGKHAIQWKYIVLDEAHVYHGAMGIEVSLLLRRLKSYVGKKVQFVLTSATLGNGTEDYPAIIDFASNLCSAPFDTSSIIGAIRKKINIASNLNRFDLNFYIEINNEKIIENLDEIKNKAKVFGYHNELFNNDTLQEYIYHIVSKDQNLYDLINTSKTHKDIKTINIAMTNYNSWDEGILVNFVNVASKGVLNGEPLFDSRYHMFIRSLEGAFVSIKPNPQIRLSRHKYIEGLKAYEIGVCRYCKSIYIIGTIDKTTNTFVQNEEVDIHETFNEWEEKQIDYFLLEKNEENDNEDIELEEYILCSKCGHIRKSAEVNISDCECGKQYKNLVYRQEPKKLSSKLHMCVACGNKSNQNVIRQLYLGKDSATSLLAQFLYNELASVSCTVKRIDVKPDRFGLNKNKKIIEQKTSKSKTKQFIAFSDSRQQAAFFASYFDSEHNKNVRKRILIETITKSSVVSIKLMDFVHDLEVLISEKDLFKDVDNMSIKNEATLALLYELLDVDKRYSLEGLGMLSFVYDMDSIDQVPPFITSGSLKDYKSFLSVIINTLRSVPAVNFRAYRPLSPDYLSKLEYRKFDNKVVKIKEKGMSYVTGWISKKLTNSRQNYIERALGFDSLEAKELLEALWIFLIDEGVLVTNNNSEYRLDFNKFNIESGRKTQWYICNKCNKTTRWNYNNICPTHKCNGKLVEVSYDELFKNNFYKKEFETLPIENISIKEHTAQLDRKKANKYQKRFINEELNILSCSTTFEMGVDVGKLETVFLRNMPPSPANYAQRAGRAGRRIDTAAYVLTYCNLSSHDFNYFNNPEKMIEGIIKPPHFVIENEKIIKRHVYAVAFGEFFMAYPELYDDVDVFFSKDGIVQFKEYILRKPESVEKVLLDFVPTNIYKESYSNKLWIKDLIDGQDCYLDIIADELNAELEDLQKALELAKINSEGNQINRLKKLLKSKRKEKIVSFLSRKNIIPKYGFPVDNVELQTHFDRENKLTRDLSIAISEYAPGSEVVVDKYKITSRYIKTVTGYSLEEFDYFICNNCGKLNTRTLGLSGIGECDVCKNNQEYDQRFLVPKFGFISDNTHKPASSNKPKKTYSGEIYYIGKGKPVDELKLEINGVRTELYSTGNDELAVINRNPFFTCPICGYSEIIQNNAFMKYCQKEHKNEKNGTCLNTRLENFNLGHNFKTDVVKISFYITIEYDKALSILYGLLEGMSSYLSIERNDISGVIIKNVNNLSYDFIFFDKVPGGAGHVKRLMNEKSIYEILNETRKLMSRDCCDKETSCYTCLRNYYNRKIHNKLKRKYVLEFLECMLVS